MDPFMGKGLDKIIEGAADGPITTLNKTWELIFGRYHNYVDKIQFRRDLNLQLLKDDIQRDVESIPQENLQEPKLSIIGPALESAKFYIEEEEIREMFSKLISSAMDDRKNIYAHHSFVEIIKQLSPNDAILLKHLYKLEVIPSGEYKAITTTEGDHIKISSTLISDSPLDIQQTELSLSNLNRVGLVNIKSGDEHYSNDKLYEPFYTGTLIEYFSIKTNELKFSHRSDLYTRLRYLSIDELTYGHDNKASENILNLLVPYCVDISKGRIDLSPIGEAFKETCMK